MTHRAVRRLAAAVVVVITLGAAAALVAGCSTEAADVAHTASVFRPAPEVPPIERLGRWTGRGFVPVAAGSVTGGHLYVLVHGWAAGYRAAVQRHRGPVPLLAWSPAAVDAAGVRDFTAFFPLAAAIAAADPRSTVLGFSWLDDAATSASPLAARQSEDRTDLNGQRLAAALRSVVGPGFAASGGQVHLIGHSHGARVATVAAIAGSPAPAQLTLLDSPENALARLPGAANHLEGYLPLLPLGRGPGRTFVDSYFSIAGASYGDLPGLGAVVDTQLFPPVTGGTAVARFTDAHEYPIGWYAASARHEQLGVGFAWSPLGGSEPRCLRCAFRQRFRQARRSSPARELTLVPAPVAAVPAVDATALDATPLRGPATGARPEGVTLTAPGPRLWQVEFDKGASDLAVAFDTRFVDPAPHAQVAVWLDDRQVYATAADWAGSDGAHAVIDVSSLADGSHTLTAVLASGRRGTHARALLGGFTMMARPGAASEEAGLSTAASLALAALGLWLVVGILIWWLHPRHRAHRDRDAERLAASRP